jgi:hypothetical protein
MMNCEKCCQNVSAFAYQTEAFTTPYPAGIVSFTQAEGALNAEFNFTRVGQIAVIQIRFGKKILPENAQVTIEQSADSVALVDYTASLESTTGSAGCKYFISSIGTTEEDGYFTDAGEYACWGGFIPITYGSSYATPSDVMNLRFEAATTGSLKLAITGVYL